MTTTMRPERSLSEIPGPAGHPVFGMAPALRRDLLGTILDSFHEHGDVVSYRFGPRFGPRRFGAIGLAAYHPDGVRQVLTQPRIFTRDTIGFSVLTEMLGQGLLTSDGDRWVRQRRTLQPLFTPRRVAGYADLMAAEAERILDSPADRVVDLHQLMQLYTLRVVGRALFGDDVDDVAPELRRLMPLTGDMTVTRTMQIARLPLPVPTPRNRRFQRVHEGLYEVIDRIIARRHPSASTDDLLSRLRAARDPETGEPLSAAEIRDQALVFLLAGHETTAGALTYTLRLLGLHPDIQDRVAAAAAGADGDETVRAAVLEGMRLYPPAYVTDRAAVVDTELAGHFVPAGTLVLVSPWVTHRHPEFWPDPERFDPGRFEGHHDRPRYAYFPFGGGPRSCIGEHFALLEATILLRALLRRHRVETLDARLRVRPIVTLRPVGPVPARLAKR